jgi:hypothetical protein
MKEVAQRNWGELSSNKKSNRIELDQASFLGGLAVLIFVYIIFRFIYPLIEKGILW